MNIEIANRLVTLRKQFNLSQEELASRLGISRQAVSRWERAEASPDTDNLINLSKIYSVSIDSLLALDDDGADDLAFQTISNGLENSDEAPETDKRAPLADDTRAGDDTEDIKKFLRHITPAYPFIVVLIYLILGFMFGIWHPAWIIFLTIPIFFILNKQ